jgi:hypothetical protein
MPDITESAVLERRLLRLWYQAMWYITNQKSGVSALGLKRMLGLGSYL